MPRTRGLIIAVLALAWGTSLGAIAGTKGIPVRQLEVGWEAGGVRAGSSTVSTKSAAPLRVENVRLEAAPRTETTPSTILKFDLSNTSPRRLTDLLLEISIAEKPTADPVLTPSRMLVRPFKIQGDVVLESGYTISYEMLLNHFSSDCDCVPNVEVLSVRSLPDSD